VLGTPSSTRLPGCRAALGVTPRQQGSPFSNDTWDWWYDSDEHASGTETHPGHYQPGWFSADVPTTGTTIPVVKVGKRTGVMTIRVGTSRSRPRTTCSTHERDRAPEI